MFRPIKLIHLALIICLVAVFVSTQKTAAQKDGLLKIYFLSVGQGDSEFIETPNGHQILIDGGPDTSVLSELGKVMPFYDHDIDVVIATHPHADHIAGLIDVLDRYEVKYIVQSQDLYDSAQFKSWQSAVEREGAKEIEALHGTVIDFGDGTILRIIYPFKSYTGTILKNPHDANVTAILSYRDVDVLFTGDMEKEAEEELIASGIDLEAEILKVGHHGSKTSTSAQFLEAVRPQAAFIEVGKDNKYNLPYPGVLSRLKDYGIPYYRTDENGTMLVSSDGRQFQVEPN